MNTWLAATLRTETDLKTIAKPQKAFEAAVSTGNHLEMSQGNKKFHQAIVHGGKNPYLASFYEAMRPENQWMLYRHFEYLQRTYDGRRLTEELDFMLEAIREMNVDLADDLVQADTRQFQANFMRANYTSDVTLGPLVAAK